MVWTDSETAAMHCFEWRHPVFISRETATHFSAPRYEFKRAATVISLIVRGAGVRFSGRMSDERQESDKKCRLSVKCVRKGAMQY